MPWDRRSWTALMGRPAWEVSGTLLASHTWLLSFTPGLLWVLIVLPTHARLGITPGLLRIPNVLRRRCSSSTGGCEKGRCSSHL